MSDIMTKLRHLVEMHGKATPGTWYEDYEDYDEEGQLETPWPTGAVKCEDGYEVAYCHPIHNAAFIVAAHNDLPEIAGEMERLAGALAEIYGNTKRPIMKKDGTVYIQTTISKDAAETAWKAWSALKNRAEQEANNA